MIGKFLLKSKTLWVNLIAIIVLIIQSSTGFVVPVEYQGYALIVINTLLRFVTKEPIVWKNVKPL